MAPMNRVDIFALAVPRRPRSKRATTVVNLMNFTIRDLPSMFLEKSPSTKTEEQSQNKSQEIYGRMHRKAPRKPKTDSAPRKVVSLDSAASAGGRRRKRKPRDFGKMGFISTGSTDSDGDIGQGNPERTHRNKARSKSFRKKIARAPRLTGNRVGSLKNVIHNCVNGKPVQQHPAPSVRSLPPSPEKDPQSEEVEEDKVEKSPEPAPTPSPVRPEGSRTETQAGPSYCLTISNMLKRGEIKPGDWVQATDPDSGLAIEGWVTHRGNPNPFAVRVIPSISRDSLLQLRAGSFLQDVWRVRRHEV